MRISTSIAREVRNIYLKHWGKWSFMSATVGMSSIIDVNSHPASRNIRIELRILKYSIVGYISWKQNERIFFYKNIPEL